MNLEIKNARITDAQWDRERWLTHWIFLEGDGWGCGFGGYGLGGEACYDWITQIMIVLDLWNFKESELIGRIVRAKVEGIGGKTVAIGHPIKEQWFEPQEFFKKYQ